MQTTEIVPSKEEQERRMSEALREDQAEQPKPTLGQRARELVGMFTDVLTHPSPGAVTGMKQLGPQVSSGLGHVATPGKRALGGLELGEAGIESATPLPGPATLAPT